MAGRVARIHVKPQTPGERGFPKHAVLRAAVSAVGLDGDFNRHRTERRAGDPSKAVLLMPEEMLRQLALEGWPIAPGDLGENFTTSAIAYDDYALGSRWRIGAHVVLEISERCDPCRNLALLSYVGAERLNAFMRALLDRRGWYARVLAEGDVTVGDDIVRCD